MEKYTSFVIFFWPTMDSFVVAPRARCLLVYIYNVWGNQLQCPHRRVITHVFFCVLFNFLNASEDGCEDFR